MANKYIGNVRYAGFYFGFSSAKPETNPLARMSPLTIVNVTLNNVNLDQNDTE